MPMPPFINRVSLQGFVSTHPSSKTLNQQTKLTTFQISVVESWRNGAGELRDRKNQIMVEVVGRDSAYVAKAAKLGSWVTLEGYLRSEQFQGKDLIKIRTFTISVWEMNGEALRETRAGDERGPGGAPDAVAGDAGNGEPA